MAVGLAGYDVLARHYDTLMQGVPYLRWAGFIGKYACSLGKERVRIVDFGCGTGTVALALAQHGFEVYGVDQSTEMLSVARHKAESANLPVTWLESGFNFELACDLIISTCDGVNHLLTTRELVHFFRHAYTCLEQGGFLIFDINSPYKFQSILADKTFYWQVPGLDLVWVNEYTAPFNRANIVLYEGEDGSQFNKSFFEIKERCYKLSSLLYYLRNCGFQRVSLWKDYKSKLKSTRVARITLVAQKN